MSNIIKYLKRDTSAVFSSNLKYTLLVLAVFAVGLFVRTGDLIYLSILLLSYICSYFWVVTDHDARSIHFLNFLPAPASAYVSAKFIFLLIALIPFAVISFADMYVFREFMKLELSQVINLEICSISSYLFFGGLSFLGVFTFGAERFKYVYGAPVFIGVLLSFFGANQPAMTAFINFFLNSMMNTLIFLGISVIVYIVSWIISRKSFNFKLIYPTILPNQPK